MLFLYNLLLLLSIPAYPALKLLTKKRGEVSLLPRLKTKFKEAEGKRLLHLSSIGEVNTVKPLVELLKESLAITTFTDYGLKRAREVYPEVPSRLLPLDLYPIVKKFLKSVKPKELLIFETEIWPSLLFSAKELKVPLYFISGKIGEKSFKRLLLFKRWLEPAFSHGVFLGRWEEDSLRARELGFKRVHTVGDLKLDYQPPKELPTLKLEGERKVLIWGSTHEGEEELAVELHKSLKEEFPELLTVIAPRHVKRKLKLPGKLLKRSESKRVPESVDFYLIDTMGELSGLYGYADGVIIGGSFVEGIGGHNPVEAVALKKPTVMGEHGFSFKRLAREIGVPVLKREELKSFLSNLLKDKENALKVAENSHKLWKEKRGVSKRIVELLGE
ncbi:3-deoxy-D-manno-octulosonic acid transferase [Thermovibrio sp.]